MPGRAAFARLVASTGSIEEQHGVTALSCLAAELFESRFLGRRLKAGPRPAQCRDEGAKETLVDVAARAARFGGRGGARIPWIIASCAFP